MLFHLLIEKHEKVVIPINVTSWKSQKINTQQEKPIFYNRINWFLKNTKEKKNTRLSEKLNIRKNFVKNSTLKVKDRYAILPLMIVQQSE